MKTRSYPRCFPFCKQISLELSGGVFYLWAMREIDILNPDADETGVERARDGSLRPSRFSDYIGQSQIKEKLEIYISAARARQEPLDHCLFYGPPGLGKTSLAHIVANEMGSHLHMTSGPVVEKAGDLAALLTNLEPLDVLFIDEIHRLDPVIEEVLYPAMEDRNLDIMIGQGPHAKSIKIDLPPFTLIGATTRAGSLTSPLRDRFGIVERLNFYTKSELQEIILRSARLLDIDIDSVGAQEIARRSRGTPRIANRLLRRLRDIAQVRGTGVIDRSMATEGLRLLDIDEMGFDLMDRRILSTIIETFHGGPVGVDTLSAAIGEEKETIEDVYEPYLLQEGFIQRTPRGRMCTIKAYRHLGISPPSEGLMGGQAEEDVMPTLNFGDVLP